MEGDPLDDAGDFLGCGAAFGVAAVMEVESFCHGRPNRLKADLGLDLAARQGFGRHGRVRGSGSLVGYHGRALSRLERIPSEIWKHSI